MLQRCQRKSSSCFTVGRASDILARQARHEVAGDITEQNLQQEQLDGRHRAEFSFSPAVPRPATGGADRFVVQLVGPGALELPNDLWHVGKHVRVSVEASVVEHSPFYGDSGFFAAAGTAI